MLPGAFSHFLDDPRAAYVQYVRPKNLRSAKKCWVAIAGDCTSQKCCRGARNPSKSQVRPRLGAAQNLAIPESSLANAFQSLMKPGSLYLFQEIDSPEPSSSSLSLAKRLNFPICVLFCHVLGSQPNVIDRGGMHSADLPIVSEADVSPKLKLPTPTGRHLNPLITACALLRGETM